MQWFPNFLRGPLFIDVKPPQSHYYMHPDAYKEMFEKMCHEIVLLIVCCFVNYS